MLRIARHAAPPDSLLARGNKAVEDFRTAKRCDWNVR